MAFVVLQVMLEVQDPHDSIGDDLQSALTELIDEKLPELSLAHGVDAFNIVFEDVV